MAKSSRDLTNQRFGKLLALRKSTAHSKSFWVCMCDCGNERTVREPNLIGGLSKSCGCSIRTHGHSLRGVKSPTMSSYGSMVSRCYHASNPAHAYYSKNGITVCDRWRFGEDGKTGFECFLADMGARPDAGLTLDRIDGAKGYLPDNCRWATRKEQARNRYPTRLYEFRGEMLLLKEIAALAGISFDAIRYRVEKLGMSTEDAATAPVQKGQDLSGSKPLLRHEYNGEMVSLKRLAELTGQPWSSLRNRERRGKPVLG